MVKSRVANGGDVNERRHFRVNRCFVGSLSVSPEAQEAVVLSRQKILVNPSRPALLQVDLGDNASKKDKKNLFESPARAIYLNPITLKS